VVERRVFELAQVAAPPDQGARVFRHGASRTL
jgi:hypothetical protein